MAEFAGAGDGVEAPEALAGSGVVGLDEAADSVFAASHPGHDFVLDHEGGGGNAVALHGIGNLDFPEGRAGAQVQGHQGGVEGTEEEAASEHGHPAVDAITLVRIDYLLGALVAPDLAAGAGIQGEDLTGRAGGVHHAVHDQRDGFNDAVTGHGYGPAGLKLAHVGGVDLAQGRVMPALQVAPVGEPVLGLGLRVGDAFGGEAAGNRDCERLGEVAAGERLQISDQVLDLGRGEAAGVVVGHERLVFDAQFGQAGLVEQVELAGGIDQLEGEDVLALAHPAVLMAVGGFHGQGGGRTAAGAPSTACRRGRLIGIEDDGFQRLGGPVPGGRKIGADGLTLAIHRVAGEALSLALEDGLAGGRVATHLLAHDHRAGEAADVRNQLPDLVGSELGEGGHGRAGDAVADVQEELPIGGAVAEDARGQSRGAVAARAGSVARLAGAVVETIAGRYGRPVSGQRISFAFERVLGEEQAAETERHGQRDQEYSVGSHG